MFPAPEPHSTVPETGRRRSLDGPADARVQVLGHADADQAVTGDVVVLAVPYPALHEIVGARAAELAGKVVVDITNPLDFETFDTLVVPADSSAAAAPAVGANGASLPAASHPPAGHELDLIFSVDHPQSWSLPPRPAVLRGWCLAENGRKLAAVRAIEAGRPPRLAEVGGDFPPSPPRDDRGPAA